MSRSTTMVGAFLCLLLVLASSAIAQTTEFTYQGQLANASAPASGNFDFEFLLYDALTDGTQIGTTQARSNVAVANGVFSVKLDFGANFPGANRSLEIHVRQSGGGVFTLLTPRQSISSTPYAVKSISADTAAMATTAGSATTASSAINFSGVLTGDVTGTQGATTVAKLRGVNVAVTPPTNGQVLQYDSTNSRWAPATLAGGVSSPANYLFAYSIANWDDAQIVFETTPIMNGWTRAGSLFTCPQTGLYQVQFTGQASLTSTNTTTAVFAVVGAPIPGSRTTAFFPGSSMFVPISKSFLVNLNAGDQLHIDVTGAPITGDPSPATLLPSATLTITQIK